MLSDGCWTPMYTFSLLNRLISFNLPILLSELFHLIAPKPFLNSILTLLYIFSDSFPLHLSYSLINIMLYDTLLYSSQIISTNTHSIIKIYQSILYYDYTLNR